MTSTTGATRSSLLGIGLAVGLAGVLSACGGSSSGGSTDTISPAAAAGGSATTVETHASPLGTYLTDGSGRTVYVFAADTGASSTCTGACATEWPPVTTDGSATAKGKVDAGSLGTTTRDDGSTQVTYMGHPLYYFADDDSAGDMNGQGEDDFGGLWSVVGPDGSPLTASTPSSEPAAGDSGSGDAWG